ncbi:hypothetical protein OZ411_39320 [Bradyrhizobium sp. Arg237L]|uniref:hypothetical protein n=1 Tax=Bradyrhizobium sp. Arg237L TaxID=3003352 RepID=UPI00249F3255|nr:hypothetical protein [Bradyrhizobium sp. Arg237L]MDI4238847.1 hypothetical protein [Bradyrhizobium sp. Arg237L]
MPVGRYIAWVGASLLALLYIADWCVPQSLTEAAGEPIERPAIRIASLERPPELVVMDTSLPTIVPPPTLAEAVPPIEPPPVRAVAEAPPPPPAVEIEKKTKKVVKRQAPKVAAVQPPLPLAPAVAPASPAPPAAPEIKLSFADIMSGQLVKNLFNLH